MATIAILVHPRDPFQRGPYIVRELARIWQEQGHRVKVGKNPAHPPLADLALLHVDLTVIPPDFAALDTFYPRVLNGRVTDISKRFISRSLVQDGDGYNGLVMVKTDANSAGSGELIHRAKAGEDVTALQEMTAKLNYHIFATHADVPPDVRNNPAFVIERFLPERRGADFLLRSWIFFGDKWTHMLVASKSPVVKLRTIHHREPLGDIPPALMARRRELGFDYGKFDYVIRDGEVVLFDANRTPTLPSPPDQYRPRAELLASGLAGFLPPG